MGLDPRIPDSTKALMLTTTNAECILGIVEELSSAAHSTYPYWRGSHGYGLERCADTKPSNAASSGW